MWPRCVNFSHNSDQTPATITFRFVVRSFYTFVFEYDTKQVDRPPGKADPRPLKRISPKLGREDGSEGEKGRVTSLVR